MFETKKAWDLFFLTGSFFRLYIKISRYIKKISFSYWFYVSYFHLYDLYKDIYLYKDICISRPWPILLAHASDPGPRPQALVLALNLYFSVLVLVPNLCFPTIQAFIGLL